MKSGPLRKAEWLEKYHWKPGKSGNPSGTRNSTPIINRIKELTSNGIEMADLLVRVMRGEILKGYKWPASYGERIDIAKYLMDRVFGKAPLTVASDNGTTLEVQKLLYMELVKHGNESGVFDIKEEVPKSLEVNDNGTNGTVETDS